MLMLGFCTVDYCAIHIVDCTEIRIDDDTLTHSTLCPQHDTPTTLALSPFVSQRHTNDTHTRQANDRITPHTCVIATSTHR